MHLKELFVVMVLAIATFAIAKRWCVAFMRSEDFVLRRNVWLALTFCAFLAPNFWLYAMVAFPVLAWAGTKDSNPAALYLVGFAIIPPVAVYIPVVGINQLFALSQARLLSLAVLLPVALRIFAANDAPNARKWTAIDVLLLAYLVLQVVLLIPYESFTNTMRRSFLLGIDTLLVYYVFSRSLIGRAAIVDAMASFAMVGVLFAVIGIFEATKGWLMYEQIPLAWGLPETGAFLMRGDNLRAQASAGHALTLGYTLSMVLGVWLYLKNQMSSRAIRAGGIFVICLGLYATHSRGPWLTALVVYLVYAFLASRGKGNFVKAVFSLAAVTLVAASTPWGAQILDSLPFIGTVDQENVLYRQRLAEESWTLVWQHPFFGDPFVTLQMEDLRQGQGIIDLMNAYAAVSLFHGLVGLALFAAFFAWTSVKTYVIRTQVRPFAPDFADIGVALIACMLGSFVFMATASVDWIEYVLAGMMSAYLASLDPDQGLARSPTASYSYSPGLSGRFAGSNSR